MAMCAVTSATFTTFNVTRVLLPSDVPDTSPA